MVGHRRQVLLFHVKRTRYPRALPEGMPWACRPSDRRPPTQSWTRPPSEVLRTGSTRPDVRGTGWQQPAEAEALYQPPSSLHSWFHVKRLPRRRSTSVAVSPLLCPRTYRRHAPCHPCPLRIVGRSKEGRTARRRSRSAPHYRRAASLRLNGRPGPRTIALVRQSARFALTNRTGQQMMLG